MAAPAYLLEEALPTTRIRRMAPLAAPSAAEIATLRARMAALGVTQTQIARYFGAPHETMSQLLNGHLLAPRRLGYDRWLENVNEFLDRYAVAIAITQRHAKEAQQEILAAHLPIPVPLVACLPTTPPPPPRARYRGVGARPRKQRVEEARG